MLEFRYYFLRPTFSLPSSSPDPFPNFVSELKWLEDALQRCPCKSFWNELNWTESHLSFLDFQKRFEKFWSFFLIFEVFVYPSVSIEFAVTFWDVGKEIDLFVGMLFFFCFVVFFIYLLSSQVNFKLYCWKFAGSMAYHRQHV